MCGIALALTSKISNIDIMTRLLNALEHRGPDKKAMITFALKKSPEWSLSMGHTRLSIVGLGDVGDQPKCISNEFGMVFNGEIYSKSTNGKRLSNEGHLSDTQWLWQQATSTNSVEPPNGTNGIWGTILFDAKEEVISVTRDPLGVIPVYAYEWQNGLIICSEIQAISKAIGQLPVDFEELTKAVSSRTLSYGRYIKGLTCISPGETHQYKILNRSISSVSSTNREYLIDYLDQKQSFEDVFNNALHKQLQADVPVGIQLSGGVDSSLIAATLAQQDYHDLTSFVARTSNSRSDESNLAFSNAATLGLKQPIEVLIDKQSFSEEILSSIHKIDPAFSHPNFFAVKKISRIAHEMGIKVLLAGEGADELFRGYSRLLPSNIARLFSIKLSTLILKHIDNKKLKFDRCLPELNQCNLSSNNYYDWIKDESMRHLLTNYLHELLYRQNIAGMSHSVEVRPPFLDFGVVAYAINNPKAFYSTSHNKTHLLKGVVKSHLFKIFPNYKGPIRKKGFSMPLQKLFNDDATELLSTAVDFSAKNLGIDRRYWFSKQLKNELSTLEFERLLWPALVTIGAIAATGHSFE